MSTVVQVAAAMMMVSLPHPLKTRPWRRHATLCDVRSCVLVRQ
jgi:hypothetical protein